MFDYLVLGLEDAAEYGLHRKEKNALSELVSEKELKGRTAIINGADEIASLLIARIKVLESQSSPKVRIKYSNEGSKNLISLYEDKPIKNVILDHLSVAGAMEGCSDNSYDIKLFVNTPNRRQSDIFLSDQKTDKGEKGFSLDLDDGKSYAIADIKHCNGADRVFVEKNIKESGLFKFSAFSAFNTTSNSVGIALAQSISFFLSEKKELNIKSQQEFLFYCLVSDYLYSSVVRPKIMGRLRSERRSIFDISETYKEVDHILNKSLASEMQRLYDMQPEFKKYSLRNIVFPWKRLFEIDFDVKVSV